MGLYCTISPSHPQYVVDCDKVASLPSFGFSMAGHTFELTGQEYILEVSGLEWNGDYSFRTAAETGKYQLLDLALTVSF